MYSSESGDGGSLTVQNIMKRTSEVLSEQSVGYAGLFR